MGCGIGYGYLHRIPVRTLPDDKATTPLLGSAQLPATGSAIPYVPPLANTFTLPGLNNVPTVPNTGKSDAEIVFDGVKNLNLIPSQSPAQINPVSSEQQYTGTQQQLQPTPPQTASAPVPSSVAQVSSAHIPFPDPAVVTSTPNAHVPLATSASIFGVVPPTSVASLNESFNLPPVPVSNNATNHAQGKFVNCKLVLIFTIMNAYICRHYFSDDV